MEDVDRLALEPAPVEHARHAPRVERNASQRERLPDPTSSPAPRAVRAAVAALLDLTALRAGVLGDHLGHLDHDLAAVDVESEDVGPAARALTPERLGRFKPGQL